jgi:hypothetical protein
MTADDHLPLFIKSRFVTQRLCRLPCGKALPYR